jgi:hypothetical protein
MKHQFRLITVAMFVILALASGSASTLAGRRVSTPASTGVTAQDLSAPEQAVKCTQMTAGPVRWLDVDEEGTPGDEVESYPSEVTRIYATFDYDCVPSKTTLTTILSYDGKQVTTNKDKPKATDKADVWYIYYHYDNEDEYFEDGEWTVEFFANGEPLASGTVMVGEDPATQVSVVGSVIDGRSKKPIKGALVRVLNPGMLAQDFIDNDEPEDDVLTSATSSSTGKFALPEPIKRNTEYSIVVTAKGYKPLLEDGYSVADDEEEPIILAISLSK